MKATLRYKNQPSNSWLQLYGEYAGEELTKAITGAGWKPHEFPPSRIPPELLREWMLTDSFTQPEGTGLFGGSSKEEWNTNITALKAALAPLGITLGRPTKINPMDLL